MLNTDRSENIGDEIQEYVYALEDVQGRSR
jgi:hypothetical protein